MGNLTDPEMQPAHKPGSSNGAEDTNRKAGYELRKETFPKFSATIGEVREVSFALVGKQTLRMVLAAGTANTIGNGIKGLKNKTVPIELAVGILIGGRNNDTPMALELFQQSPFSRQKIEIIK